MAGQLQGKVALVTGGSSGIGRASALAFAREGAKVIVADVVVEGGRETVGMIKKAGSEGLFVKTDVSRAPEVEALINRTIETYGRLDCALNNAGIRQKSASFTEVTEDVWDRIININLKSVWLCMKYEIPQMLNHGGGAIVNTASTGGVVALWNIAIYVASKHGVIGLTKTAALEYAKAGIRVNAVCPALMRTPMSEPSNEAEAREQAEMIAHYQPIGRKGEPEEVAEAAVWLCSDRASFVTGHVMAVDGGWTAQ